MRKVSPGLVCIVLGVVLLLAAGGLYAYNRYEDAHAGADECVFHEYLLYNSKERR